MTEREEIIEKMAELSARKSRLAEKARLAEKIDPVLLRPLVDLYDAWHDAASDEIGRLQFRLHEIEAIASRKVLLWDAAYGRNP
jgi:hypothetical protein